MENKKIIFLAAGLIAAVFFILGALKISQLNASLSSMRLLADSAQKEQERLKAEKEKVSKEKEVLQADLVSSLAANSQLQNEREMFKKNSEDARADLADKDAELQIVKVRLEKFEKAYGKEISKLTSGQKEEKAGLEYRVRELEMALNKQKNTYYFNMGVMYAQQGKSEEAVDAYRRALKFDPKDADALYNLAVLYEEYENDPKAALECYEKLLQLNPLPEDKEEIEDAVKRLGLFNLE